MMMQQSSAQPGHGSQTSQLLGLPKRQTTDVLRFYGAQKG